MLKLRVILLAGALAVATVPALAIDLPDYGSKNFSPSGDTPSYFANEAAPVSARTADTTQHDWSAVDDMAATEQNFEGTRSAYTDGGQHGRYSVAHRRPSRHTAGKYGGTTRSVRASAAGGYAGKTAHNSAAQTRNVSAARTTTAKHGKPGARHASAGGAHYIVN